MAYTEPQTAIRAKYANLRTASLDGQWLYNALAAEFEDAVKDLKASVIERSQSLVDAMDEWADKSVDYIKDACKASGEDTSGDFCRHLVQHALSDIGSGSSDAAANRAIARAIDGVLP